MTEPAPETAPAPRRGRPRPDHTIAQDEKVFAAITGPMTRAQLATATELGPNQVYLSLYRLKRDGRIVRTRQGGEHVWAHVAAEG